MKLNGLSLFSGIGGLEVGLQPWVTTKAYCEIDPYAQAVLKSRMADSEGTGQLRAEELEDDKESERGGRRLDIDKQDKIYGTQLDKTEIFTDITKLAAADLPKPIDIIIGGFPCQDISNAGKRKGIKAERSGLWFEMLRLISELRPSYVFVENVHALLNRGLDTVLGSLAEIGYDAVWTSLRAADVGAPHRRERVFILAYPASDGCKDGHTQAKRAERQGKQRRVLQSQGAGVADTAGNGRLAKRHQTGEPCQALRETPAGQSCRTGGSQCVADSTGERIQRVWPEGKQEPEVHVGKEIPVCYGLPDWKHDPADADPASESFVGRVASGIPNRVDRIKCLGNAVVPQQAREAFIRLITIKQELN